MRNAPLVVVGLLIATALVLSTSAAQAAPKQSPSSQAKAAWGRLVADTNALTRKQATRKVRRQLLATARRGQRAWRSNPCRSRTLLGTFGRQAKKVKKGRKLARREVATGTGRGKLQADAATVDAALLLLPRARPCGGARASGVAEAGATVIESNERTLKMHVQLPPPQFVPHQAGGQDFVEMTMEGMGKTGDNGKPGLPEMTKLFAIPEGATVSTDLSNVQSYTLKGGLTPHRLPTAERSARCATWRSVASTRPAGSTRPGPRRSRCSPRWT
jgi:hypothetical protein